MSLLAKLQAEAAANKTAPEARVETAVQETVDTTRFEITEAAIKQNPAYAIVTDTSKSEETRISELVALKTYNPALTPEANAANLTAFNDFLLYAENQVLDVTQKSVAFTNDEAFSLFDQTVQTLQTNLGIFKGNLEPLVKAFGVMQKARNAGIPPHKLLAEVQELRDGKKKLDDERNGKAKELERAKRDLKPLERDAQDLSERLDDRRQAVGDAQGAQAKAEGVQQAEEAKFFLTRDKQKLAKATETIAQKKSAIAAYQDDIAQLTRRATGTASQLEAQNALIGRLESEVGALETQIGGIDAKLGQDEDTQALSKLLEITGPEFKDKRQELVGSVQTMVSTSVKDFERAMARFDAGGKEVGTMRDTVTNVGGMVEMVAKADAKVRVNDAAFIEGQEAIVKKIRDEKGDDAIYDPAYEVAKTQYENATRHSREGLTIAGRTGELSEKLTRQEGVYTGLTDAFRQKFIDAQRLRTNAAVDVSSKLLTTTKALEMAIASEKTGAVDDILAELSASSTQATADIFNMVSQGKSAENDRLTEALKQAIETAKSIDAVTKDLREQTRKGIASREALRQVRADMETLNEGLVGIGPSAEREMQRDGLQQAGEAEALRVAAANDSGTKSGKATPVGGAPVAPKGAVRLMIA